MKRSFWFCAPTVVGTEIFSGPLGLVSATDGDDGAVFVSDGASNIGSTESYLVTVHHSVDGAVLLMDENLDFLT